MPFHVHRPPQAQGMWPPQADQSRLFRRLACRAPAKSVTFDAVSCAPPAAGARDVAAARGNACRRGQMRALLPAARGNACRRGSLPLRESDITVLSLRSRQENTRNCPKMAYSVPRKANSLSYLALALMPAAGARDVVAAGGQIPPFPQKEVLPSSKNLARL